MILESIEKLNKGKRKDNRYGHPHRETIEKLQKYSKEIISTIDRGTISFVTDGRTLEVETSRR
jgi:competence protein ComEC